MISIKFSWQYQIKLSSKFILSVQNVSNKVTKQICVYSLEYYLRVQFLINVNFNFTYINLNFQSQSLLNFIEMNFTGLFLIFFLVVPCFFIRKRKIEFMSRWRTMEKLIYRTKTYSLDLGTRDKYSHFEKVDVVEWVDWF